MIAISFTLVLAASGVFNFAQGTIVMGDTILAFLFGVVFAWPTLVVVAAVIGIGVLADDALVGLSTRPHSLL